jgi:hypothetical protein
MTRSVSLTLSVFPLLISAGCGSMIVNEASSDSSGSGGSGPTTASGSGGTGGDVPAPPCKNLVQTGELTGLPSLPNTLSWRPRLRSLGDGQTAIVYTIAVPGMGPQNTVSTNVAWTGAWPPASALPVELVGRPWYKSSAAPSKPKSLGLLGWSDKGAPEVAFGFADALNGGWTELVSTDPKAVGPAFVAAGEGGQFFVGMAVNAGIPSNNVATPHVGWVATKGTTSYTGPIDLGCPIDPVSADAVAVDGGWLLARSAFDNDCYGSAGQIRVTRFTDGQPQPDVEIDSGSWEDPVLVPRPGGAWLLYGQSPAGMVVGARLGALGQVELGPLVISGPETGDPRLLAADALDGGLVAVLSDGPSPTALTIVVTDQEGVAIASAPLDDVSAASELQIAFDPTTRQALVALTLPDETGTGPQNRIHVARFSCQ